MNILPNKNSNPNNRGKRPLFSMYWMYALIILSLIGLYYFQEGSQTREVDWTEFEKISLQGDVTKITVNPETGVAVGVLTPNGAKKLKFDDSTGPLEADAEKCIRTTIPSPDKIQEKFDTWNGALTKEGKPTMQITYERSSDIMKIIWSFAPLLLIILFMVWMSKRLSGGGGNGGGIFSVGKSRARVFDKKDGTNVTFKDVAGLAEAKVEIQEIVEFLKRPQKYTELGAKIPKGALLVGPPGTGKTLLAKAVAGEANVPFLSMSGSDFVEMFVGVGAARVRDLFKQAKEKAPCIVFIDEIDAVGRARGKNPNMGSNDERENTLNQMLTEMDGFGSNNGVIVLAATNRADMLDKALLRPGRFDRQIYVDLPELTDRVEIFQVHLRNIKVSNNLDVEQLARQTQGFSGADIANVCNEAALIAARNGSTVVDWDDFMGAIDRIVGGLEKRSLIITDEEKHSIATHEAGHATITWLIRYGNPLLKVTIVPRGRALGAAWYEPEARQIIPTQALLDSMCGLLGGRAAEEVFLGQVGTGASDDLEKCTKIARSLVMMYGMSPKLPNLNYNDSTGQAYGFNNPYSEETAKIIDEEVKRIINEQYERAKSILREYAEQHNKIRDLLIEREVIYHDDVQEILGPRKWKSRTDEIIEINKKLEQKKDTNKYDNPYVQDLSDVNADKNAKDKNTDDSDEDPGTPPPFNK
ncbi:MAG: ATP-dependent zinc metalloprotease FtsH [Clostridium sp.]|nr:ATP-dependent zinc metalloprotease FtsH [Prevotella sp.]MCM1429328.1 ATP-dependent zinc metalloprotease FtsH [Clostridium sp.]MCM1475638.1 ATP-dependent zinc metalloprotease FtsH [Muribaculaceae bacterium]